MFWKMFAYLTVRLDIHLTSYQSAYSDACCFLFGSHFTEGHHPCSAVEAVPSNIKKDSHRLVMQGSLSHENVSSLLLLLFPQ